MLLWLIFAAMTAAALAFVLRPMFVAVPAGGPGAAAEAYVGVDAYVSQLAELDQQLADGRLEPADYGALREEISRRILRADHERAAEPPLQADGNRWRPVAFAAACVVPLITLGGYLALGTPSAPSHPFSSGAAVPRDANAQELIARVEQQLAKTPDDARGWEVIAPVYMHLDRFADAANAYKRAIALAGETPQRLAGFAEANVMANDGIVGDEARAAYEKLLKAYPDRFEPRFWLALAKEQDGQRDAAAADYRLLLAAAPADAPWRPAVEERLAAVTETAAPPPAKEPGPTAADIAASSSMSPADRAKMIASMVEGLAQRLKVNGRDADGWQRLINAYATMNEPSKARTALADARSALQSDTAAVARIDALAKRLGIAP